MHPLAILLPLTLLLHPTISASCNRDNCFRAIISYESKSDPGFCNQYLATSPPAAPSPFATCGPSRISSACTCLTTTPSPTPTTTPSPSPTTSCPVDASATGCPTKPNPCCAWYCGAALVPFDFCSPTDDISDFSSCYECPS